jgi:hypothetical protein
VGSVLSVALLKRGLSGKPVAQRSKQLHQAGEAATEVVQRPRSFNVGREALPHEVEVANDLTPSTTPTPEMVDSHARGAHPDLFARADDLDNQLQQARAQVQEALQPTTPEPLAGSRIAALQQELDQFTGKRRSSPRAKAVKAELTQLQAQAERVANAQAGSNADRLLTLRQRAAELDVRRGLLGPEINAARTASEAHLTKALAEQAAARPLHVLGPVPEGTAERPVKWREITAANDPYSAPAARPGGVDAVEAVPHQPAPATPPSREVIDRASLMAAHADKEGKVDIGKVGDSVKQQVSDAIAAGHSVKMVIEGKPREIVGTSPLGLVDKNGNPWGVGPLMMHSPGDHARIEITPQSSFHGSSVGAQQVQYPHLPLDLNTGDIGTVREKGQFTSNIRTKNASVSHVLTPASGTQLASSPFAPSRIIAAFMAGNPLGYKNAKNPLDAAMSALLMRGRANGVLDRYLKPAFHEWATDRGYGRIDRLTRKPEFMREVYDYITAKGTPEAHPAVARYANQAVKPLLKEWTERINESGLAEHLPYDTNYLPRIYDPGKVGDAYNTHGVGNLTNLVKSSMSNMEWTKALTPEQLDRVSRGYAEGISKKALDLQEDWNHSWSADNLDHLRSVLVSDSGMSAEEAKGVTDAVARLTEKDRGANGRLKNRVDLDINAQHPATGDLRLSDMLVKDVSYLMERYNDQMSGRVALAKMKIVDPDTGDVIVNGIKNDHDFETMIREWKRTTEEQYLSKASGPAEKKNLLNWRKLDEANMRFQYNRISLAAPKRTINCSVGTLSRVRSCA